MSGWDWEFDMYSGGYDFVNRGNGQGARSYPPGEILEFFGLNQINAIAIATVNDSEEYYQFSETIKYLENVKDGVYG